MPLEKFERMRTGVFFGLLLVVGVLAIYIILPFLSPLLWAAVLASLFYPLYKIIRGKIKNESASAFSTVAAVVFVVLIPVLLAAVLLIRESVGIYNHLSNPETIKSITEFIDSYSSDGIIGQAIENLDLKARVQNSLSTIATALLSVIRQGSASTLAFLAKLFLMLYALFFFLRDGKGFLLKLKRLLPLGDGNEEKLYNNFSSTARATLKGSILLSVIQGLFAGLGLFIVSFPGAMVLTIFAIILAIIPAVGPALILVPAAIYLFFTASLWQAITLLVVTVLVSVSDNILRPILVGGDIEMHPAVFLFSTVGGIVVFGISGIVFGPILMSLFLALLQMYEKRYRKMIDTKGNNKEKL